VTQALISNIFCTSHSVKLGRFAAPIFIAYYSVAYRNVPIVCEEKVETGQVCMCRG
jgi:hypothetical protein